ncbi:MAG: cation:proton antiporter family protein [Thiomicrorhabdus chilensis]|uniref:cation:proton antiporter n=1 Tax=Thiomicrorhabdus chilensis TaxID=63656 RepID=UPI00299F3AD8|nr:cation:proton antiporter family protein [Thiomicrorhabdus chilensis]MDX1348053.1 cation:proton antiporter family protein [Thiomicrorhabdus chilensis]
MFESAFLEFSVLLGISAVMGLLAVQLRQPLIVAFIAVGILVGPSALGLIESSEKLELLAHLGIAILLFVVGLKLDLHIIRTLGIVALLTGLGQVVFTSVVGFFIALALGLSPIGALYVAVALTFSSTIIIVKLLSDKRELDALHGRIAIGFLIVQDIVVVLAMIALTALGQSSQSGDLTYEVLMVLIKGLLMLVVVALLMRYLIPPLLSRLARSPELLILFAIAWAVLGASAGYMLGFSQEVGAFLAGISLASTHYRELIAARLVSLRDFLLLFFFINLGANLDMSTLGLQIVPAMVLSVFVLIGNPLIVMVIMGYIGYRKRTGFLAGLTVAQISEFSLILAALGFTLGHIDQATVGLITLVGLITISASTYMILYSQKLYEKLAPFLGVFERSTPFREVELDQQPMAQSTDVILFGLGRLGMQIAQSLQTKGLNVLAVDFNPELLQTTAQHGVPTRYGDAEDPEFILSLPLSEAQWVVSTLRERPINLALLKSLKESGYQGKTALAAHHQSDSDVLVEQGADITLIPYQDAALEAVTRILQLSKME